MNSPTIPQRDRRGVLALAFFYVALAVCWQDVSFYDELFYMDSGARFRWGTLLHSFSYAPLYALWYRALQLVCTPPLWRYFLSWTILSIVLITLPLWMKLRRAWLFAWMLVCVPVFGPTNLSIRPHIVLFAAAILLFGMCLVLVKRMNYSTAALAAFGACFVTAFARPEFAYGAFLAAGVYIALSVSGSIRTKHVPWAKWGLAFCMVVVLVHALRHSDMTRSGIAFAQHYNIRAQAEHKLPPEVDAWSSAYALQVFHLDPAGTAAKTTTTIAMFARASPRLFAEQVLSNLTARITVLGLIVLMTALAWPWFSKAAVAMRPAGLYLLLVAVGPCGGILLVYPERHYFFTLCPVLMLYVATVTATSHTNDARDRMWLRYRPWMTALGLGVVLLKTVGWPTLLKGKLQLPHPQIATIQCLRQLDSGASKSNELMYDAIGVPPVMLPSPHIATEAWDIKDWSVFSQWIHTARPAWVEVTPLVPRFYGVSPSELEDLLRRDGYTPHSCPASAPNAPLTIYMSGN